MGDWLVGQKEKPQTFNMYNRVGIRNDITPERKKIYFFVTDEKIKPDFLAKLKLYCEAYFTGLTVEIMYPNDTKTT